MPQAVIEAPCRSATLTARLLCGCGYGMAIMALLSLMFSWWSGLNISHLHLLIGFQGPDTMVETCWALAWATALAGAGRFWSRHSALEISQDWIRFPLGCAASLKSRLQRRWTDLKSVSAIVNGEKRVLHVFFKSGGGASLDLAKFDRDKLEQILLMFRTRGETADLAPSFLSLLDEARLEKIAQGDVSYTSLWEDEINRRFSSVPFVPKENGQILAAGEITIVRQIALGGLSAIYLGLRNKEHVVLKEVVVPETASEDLQQKTKQLLQREASLLMQIDHPQIVKVLDYFEEVNRNYLVLQYIPGENLRQIVHRAPILESTTLDWGIQLAGILQYLHSHNPPVVHRDLTPDNIIVNKAGELTLIDFGAADEFLGKATGTIIGKQSYMSPEQFRGKTTLQSDLYGFGCTIHFLLTGQDPEPLTQSQPRLIKDHLSEDFSQLVADCTYLECNSRIQTADELVSRLSRIRTGATKLNTPQVVYRQ